MYKQVTKTRQRYFWAGKCDVLNLDATTTEVAHCFNRSSMVVLVLAVFTLIKVHYQGSSEGEWFLIITVAPEGIEPVMPGPDVRRSPPKEPEHSKSNLLHFGARGHTPSATFTWPI